GGGRRGDQAGLGHRDRVHLVVGAGVGGDLRGGQDAGQVGGGRGHGPRVRPDGAGGRHGRRGRRCLAAARAGGDPARLLRLDLAGLAGRLLARLARRGRLLGSLRLGRLRRGGGRGRLRGERLLQVAEVALPVLD